MAGESVPTFTATIYVGLRNRDTGVTIDIGIARDICRTFCDESGFCVSFTATEFIYTNGCEPGVAVGIINYPRFPMNVYRLRERARCLAELLMVGLEQKRVSVVFHDHTIMLSAEGTDE